MRPCHSSTSVLVPIRRACEYRRLTTRRYSRRYGIGADIRPDQRSAVHGGQPRQFHYGGILSGRRVWSSCQPGDVQPQRQVVHSGVPDQDARCHSSSRYSCCFAQVRQQARCLCQNGFLHRRRSFAIPYGQRQASHHV